MVTNGFAEQSNTVICKQLSKLPPVVSDWQQSCKEPQCAHFNGGECGHAGRESTASPCPFDGKDLPMVDAAAA